MAATNTRAPSHAPSSLPMPPMTAMMSRSMVAPIEIVFGSICPFHHTFSTPAVAATKPASVKANVRWSGTWNPSDAIRIGSSRTPSSATPNGVRLISAEADVGEHGEHEADVVQPHRPVEQRRRIDAGDAAEAGDGRHLSEDVVADHGVGEGQHEEVDAERAARQRTENQGDDGGDHERRHDRDPRIEPERAAPSCCPPRRRSCR